MASLSILPIHEEIIDRTSPYCSDPNCTSCKALREEYADITIRSRNYRDGIASGLKEMVQRNASEPAVTVDFVASVLRSA
ncbi:MAG: hypothetical protein JWO91_3239 [Acidobacteriaceae bacterium]|jgi:hypothetical protein|nr:hypothetical protein [Acidobacteriaceae bacterium]